MNLPLRAARAVARDEVDGDVLLEGVDVGMRAHFVEQAGLYRVAGGVGGAGRRQTWRSAGKNANDDGSCRSADNRASGEDDTHSGDGRRLDNVRLWPSLRSGHFFLSIFFPGEETRKRTLGVKSLRLFTGLSTYLTVRLQNYHYCCR